MHRKLDWQSERQNAVKTINKVKYFADIVIKIYKINITEPIRIT